MYQENFVLLAAVIINFYKKHRADCINENLNNIEMWVGMLNSMYI